MPKKSYVKRTHRKKTFRKKRGVTRPTVNRSREPVASKLLTRLTYSEMQTGSTSTTPSDTVFRLNSIYDPNLSAVGHQPYGHDQLATLYNRYRVYKVTGHILLSTASTVPVRITLLANNSGSAISNADLAAEMPGSKTINLAAGEVRRIPFTYFPRVICGSSKDQYKTDDRYQAQFGANPLEEINLHCIHTAMTGTITTYMEHHLVYWIECYDPHPLTQS